MPANSSISSYVVSERASVRLLVNDEVVSVRVSELSDIERKKVSHKNKQSMSKSEKPSLNAKTPSKPTEKKNTDNGFSIKVREMID